MPAYTKPRLFLLRVKRFRPDINIIHSLQIHIDPVGIKSPLLSYP
jgi:hypothetical protein